MKALILSAHEDTGGVGIALARAMTRHTDWEVRFVHRFHNYICYPSDIYWEKETPKPAGLDDLFREADVIHVVESWAAVDPFDGWRDKPLVMHHHGTMFREWDTANLIATVAQYEALGIVSTPDLMLIDPTLTWLPNPCDIGRMRRIRDEGFAPHDTLRIAHSPTNRWLKATDGFIASVAGTGIDRDVIEWTDWESCLRRKAAADIFYDQLHIGYALSGIEAMAMGIPVIAGAYDRRIIDLMLNLFDYLPFLLATPETLRERIEHMKDPEVRRTVAAVGTAHVERWHDEAKVATRLAAIYERAMAMR
jgi:hypothetical protein